VTGTDISPGDATDRRLHLLVGAVVMAAGAALCIALGRIGRSGSVREWLTIAIVLAFLVVVAGTAVIRVRIKSTTNGISWTDAAILVGLATAPMEWVILTAALGIIIARATRTAPIKVAFAAGKETLCATAGGVVLLSFGLSGPIGDPLRHMAALAAAWLAMFAVDELLVQPVLALDSRTTVRVQYLTNWDIRITANLARFAAVMLTLSVLQIQNELLIAVPPVVLCVHLWHKSRLRSRGERKAWQKLASATDALNEVDLGRVLHTAVIRASDLFSAHEAEVELWLATPRRLVRGTTEGVQFDGPLGDSPADALRPLEVPLEGHDGSADVGVLRLRFRRPVALNEREDYTLRTFASALCTAIRNASAYAELARAAEEHAHAARHDALTGLPNRRRLFEDGGDLLGGRHADGIIALLLIDLNHFKEVNDTLGHAAGDRVLIQVAHRLRHATRADDLVARLGGDEFAVLFRTLTAPAVAAHRSEQVLAALHEPIEIDGMRISVEASGGIAVAEGTGGITELLRRADVAMYQAKRSAQRFVTYARARDTADVGRLALGGDLPRAVAEHEFTVNFQPIVDLGTGEVLAAEALARWHHPDRGNIDPTRFLETVERSGLLPAFAEAVLDQSLIAAGNWRDAGFDLPVAVNVSPRSLLDARFPDSVLARLRAHDIPPDRLFLELTETLTISQLEVVDQVLGRLRDAGVRLALDDFGTGYSSLSVLSRIPVHELKVDRAFVLAMETSAEASAVIRSTVDLGRSLDLAVVAEGVESEPQRRALWELGCAAGQGHLFARPMPAARLLAALHRGSGGRPGTLAPPLHDEGAVIRLPAARRASGRGRSDRLPHSRM
jgi:diguanylate cyclase (GGDEF)-like protein